MMEMDWGNAAPRFILKEGQMLQEPEGVVVLHVRLLSWHFLTFVIWAKHG